MSIGSPLLIITGLQNFRSMSRDGLKLSGLSPHDAAIFCAALGLKSTDESWYEILGLQSVDISVYDEIMDDPLFVGSC
jgi:hypothetical protein